MFKFCPKCGNQYIQQPSDYQFICTVCSYVFYLNSKPTVSALIVDGNKILLGKRRVEPAKGKWDIIGGFLNYNEKPEQGLVREVKEETGLDVTIKSYLDHFIDEYGEDKEATLNMAFIVKIIGGQLAPADDIEELQWFSAQDLPKDMAFKNGQQMLDTWVTKTKATLTSSPPEACLRRQADRH